MHVVVLLGYFKVKPVLLAPTYSQIKQDLKYVYSHILPGSGLRPFNLTQKARHRIYQKILALTDYDRWLVRHTQELASDLLLQAQAWNQPRALFDRAVEYLSAQKIAIPGYTVLQDVIGSIVATVNDKLILRLESLLSQSLSEALASLVSGTGPMNLRQLRQSARNFTGPELDKELAIHQHIQHWMPEVLAAVKVLSLSEKNLGYFAERVDYYGAKLKRQPQTRQQLYLYRFHQILEAPEKKNPLQATERTPLGLWYCDVCGNLIEPPQKAYVIWKSKGKVAKDFKIIHQNQCDLHDHNASIPLDNLLGLDGLTYLLAFLSVGPIHHNSTTSREPQIEDFEAYVDLVRRVQIPYYEQARRRFRDRRILENFYDSSEAASYRVSAVRFLHGE